MSTSAKHTIQALHLSDEINNPQTVTKEQAVVLFNFFKTHPLFKWKEANNDCEDRANAISLLFKEWGLPNYKAWVFSGYFLKKDFGSLKNYWNYHVAAALPVLENKEVQFYVLDPSTLAEPALIQDWAGAVTHTPNSYYVIKEGSYYIFHHKKIKNNNWYPYNRQNYKWTIQGLAGINGVSAVGKARICFNKKHIKNTELLFKKLKGQNPLL